MKYCFNDAMKPFIMDFFTILYSETLYGPYIWEHIYIVKTMILRESMYMYYANCHQESIYISDQGTHQYISDQKTHLYNISLSRGRINISLIRGRINISLFRGRINISLFRGRINISLIKGCIFTILYAYGIGWSARWVYLSKSV